MREVERKAGNVGKPHPDVCSESIGPFLQTEASKPGLVINCRCNHPTVHTDWVSRHRVSMCAVPDTFFHDQLGK